MTDENIPEDKIKQIIEETVHQELEKQKPAEDAPSQANEQAIIASTNAHNIALQTLHYCESMGGKFTDPEILNVLEDCAELCGVLGSVMLRNSKLKLDLAEVCSKACDDCVKFAENFPEDQHMKNLLQYCKVATEAIKKIT